MKFHRGSTSRWSLGLAVIYLGEAVRDSLPGRRTSQSLPRRAGSARLCLAWMGLLCLLVGLPPAASAQDGLDDAGAAALDALEQATVSAIEQAGRSVVAIARVRRDREPSSNTDPLRLRATLSPLDSPENPDFVPSLYGSGVVISQDGYIVTCATCWMTRGYTTILSGWTSRVTRPA